MPQLSVPDLMNVLNRAAGVDETIDLDTQALGRTALEDLGYESLAILEAAGIVEREHGVSLDETALANARTPEELVEVINSVLH